ncbi:MAG: hypothetical protein M1831_001724 [Alyxoria varia]|nr:MAG: hypothetical protein M1831_001724 [Alyxoria varia]
MLYSKSFLFLSASILLPFCKAAALPKALPFPEPVPVPDVPIAGCDPATGACGGFGPADQGVAPSPTPLPTPKPWTPPAPGEQCASHRILTNITIGDGLINWGDLNPWDTLAHLSAPGGTCTGERGVACRVDKDTTVESTVILGSEISHYDSCPQCGSFQNAVKHNIKLDVLEQNVKDAEQAKKIVWAMEETLKSVNIAKFAPADRLPLISRGNWPNGLVQNWNTNYTGLASYDGDIPCMKLSLDITAEPQNAVMAKFATDPFSGFCSFATSALYTVGAAVSVAAPQIGIPATFLGSVVSLCSVAA